MLRFAMTPPDENPPLKVPHAETTAPPDSSQTMKVGDSGIVSGGWLGPFPSSSNPAIVQITEMNIGTEPDFLMTAVAVGTAIVTLQYQNGTSSKITVTVIA